MCACVCVSVKQGAQLCNIKSKDSHRVMAPTLAPCILFALGASVYTILCTYGLEGVSNLSFFSQIGRFAWIALSSGNPSIVQLVFFSLFAGI